MPDPTLIRRSLLTGALASLAAGGAAQAQSAGDLLRGLARDRLGQPSSGGLPPGVSTSDAEGGLREALANGAMAAVLRLGRTDGYWGDPVVRIPLPGTLGTLQRNLGRVGLAGPLDDLQLRMNRGAEGAAPQARGIFSDAIRSFTITDVVSIVRGPETSATDLLRERTRPQLVTLFSPPMRTSLDQSGAAPAFDRVANRYNRQLRGLGGLQGLAPEMSGGSLRDQFVAYAVGKGLDGLFHYVGEEERAIRRDPVKRTSDLLRRVFGG